MSNALRRESPKRTAALVITGTAALAFAWSTPAVAQPGGPLDFHAPQLALVTGGHHAPIRSLLFTKDGRRLLSAGQDKVILVWDLTQEPPVVVRTIRPPVYRGFAGTIYTMALTEPDADGQAVLAVGGVGVSGSRGNILLYRFPGVENRPTGEILGELPGDVNGVDGHASSVMAVAFSPDGRRLASASLDGTVRLWDHAARRLLATIPATLQADGTPHPLHALAFPTADRLVTGGGEGALHVWNVTEGAEPVAVADRPYLALAGETSRDYEKSILTLGVGRRDDAWAIYTGHESGQLVRFDGLDDPRPTRLLAPLRVRGNVGPLESLAVRADGGGLAYAQVRTALLRPGDLPSPVTDIAIRDELKNLARPLESRDNLVYALAYGPGDRWLAVAGGDDQAITLHDLRDGGPPRILKGRGRSIWQVGWRADGKAVGSSGDRLDAVPYTTYDLAERTVGDPAAANTLKKAIATWNNWRVQPTTPWTLDLIDPAGRRHPITLSTSQDRRWWSYSFLPPVAGGRAAVLAVGCEGGVALFRLDPREQVPTRLRMLAGHSGPVYSLAPSPDGRWLATGSADQTVRLWSIVDADRPAAFGAEFRREGGETLVAKVTPGGFADRAGLRAGDRVLKFVIGNDFVDAETFFRQADAVEPNRPVQMTVERGRPEFRTNIGTTKRDAPLLNLFVPDDRQWILWSQEGYYDTSIAGDARHLGWHRNGFTTTEPTEFHLAEVFEAPLRRKDMLDWAFANAARPPAPGAVILETEAPPVVRFVEPAGAVGETIRVNGPLRVRVRVERAARDRLARLDLYLGTRSIPLDNPDLDPAADEAVRAVDLDLEPGYQVLTAQATNTSGRTARAQIEVYFDPPPQPVKRHLAVVTYGPAVLPRPVPSIRFADEDARQFGDFFQRPAGEPRFEDRWATVRTSAEETTGQGLLNPLEELVARKDRGELGRGDTVVVALESHLFVDPKSRARFLLGSDAKIGEGAAGVPVEEITTRLGMLTDYGCRVLLLLDLRHKETPKSWLGDRALDEWARELTRARVIVFLASDLGPSQRLTTTGAFAEGVVRSLDARGLQERTGPISLRDFARNVIDRVQDRTGRKQIPFCAIPPMIDPRSPILDPQPADPPVGAPVLVQSEGAEPGGR